MSKTVWHKGPPPSIGWWPASMARDAGVYRWWDGKWWSVGALKDNSAKKAARLAAIRCLNQHRIEWTDRPKSWPERSRT